MHQGSLSQVSWSPTTEAYMLLWRKIFQTQAILTSFFGCLFNSKPVGNLLLPSCVLVLESIYEVKVTDI